MPSPDPAGVVFVRHPRARRYVLRVRADGVAQVTVPRSGTLAFARSFVAARAGWIERQRQRQAQRGPARTWTAGTPVWFRGAPVALEVADGLVRLGDLAWRSTTAGDLRPEVEARLRRLAERELPGLVQAAAARHQLVVRRVSIRNQRTRWGSCSRRGTVSLNWRLVQLPWFVRDYLVAHELAHLVQMNHSPAFWAVVERFDPAWREAEAWLRRHGRDLIG